MTDLSRRGFIATAGGALAAAWLAADPATLRATGLYVAQLGRAGVLPPFEVLTPEQGADLEAAAAQIIPTDETPGATEARVVYFIDRSLATWQKGQRRAVVDGLAELRKRARAVGKRASFAALTPDQQRGIIASLEETKHPFFGLLRGATIVGMLSNPEYGGNFNKLGWKMIGFDDRFSWTAPFGWYDANEG